MGRHRQWHKRALADERGQGTVEYAVVTAALLCVVLGLAALWRMASSGELLAHALLSASHHVQGALGWVVDLFIY